MYKNLIKNIFFKEIDSTQSFAEKYAIDLIRKEKSWHAVRADTQTQGRGQAENRWESPVGNLYVTFIIPINFTDLQYMSLYPSLVGISVCQNLETFGLFPKIKWINDILVADSKISGNLCKIISQEETNCLLIGIGLNVNMVGDSLKSIDQSATSIRIELGKTILVNDVYEDLSEKLYQNIQNFIKDKDFTPYEEYLKTHLAYTNRNVKIISKKNPNEYDVGKFIGLNKFGHAVLKLSNGEIKEFYEGRMFVFDEI